MNTQRIQFLIGLIPSSATYLAQIPRDCSALGMPDEVDLYAYATHDPQFSWEFIQSFARLNLPLPAAVNEPELLRGYCYLRYKNQDPDVLAALALENPANYQKCIWVRCLLILGYDYPEISHYTGLSEGACRIYATLFWDLRDRHRIDVISLTYPQGRQLEFLPGYARNESLMNLALRAAFQHGLPAVEQLLGPSTAPASADSDVAAQATALIAQTLKSANLMIEWGFGHQDLEVFSRALHVLRFAKSASAQQELEGARASRERMSQDLAKALSDSAKRIVGADRQLGERPDAREAENLPESEAQAAGMDIAAHEISVDSDPAKEVQFLRAA